MCNEVYFAALHNGCDALKSEMMESMSELFPSSLVYTDSIDKADMVVFFCCSFTSEREDNSIEVIKELQQKGKKVVVSGCFLPRFKEQFANVDFVHRKDLKKYFEEYFIITIAMQPRKVECLDANNTPIINIASGCVGHCAYCSIRQVRGRLISRTMDDILQRISQIENCTRIKLVAQDVSAYGYDFNSSLPNLLRCIWDKHPNLIIELGCLNIRFLKDYSKSDLELLKNIEGNLNLPVQSASNVILKKMGRDYMIEDFYRLYEILSAQNCKISTDIIAGFPTESEQDHLMNMNLMKDFYFDFAEVFMFDPRPNTQASAMDQVDTIIKERRTVELIVQFLSTFQKKNHYTQNKIQEIQFYNTNITI